MKIKKGDTVKILSGVESNKTGEVLKVFPKTSKILIKGINVRKKHVKPRSQGAEGGIIEKEFPINASKAMVVCPKCGKATRIGYEIVKGTKVRVCKKCNAKLKDENTKK
ncbi:MAG: 50S ribosomal protein L24 [Clostridium sp.]